MNVWRLMAHHEYPAEMAEWSRRQGVLAIGWGGVGDLSKQQAHNEEEMKRLVKSTHPGVPSNNWVNGGCSLWRLYSEVRQGDLVIISASSWRALTMRVTGDYYFDDEDASNSYEHRRKGEVVPIDPDWLWHFADGKASGANIRHTLIRCANTLTEAEAFR